MCRATSDRPANGSRLSVKLTAIAAFQSSHHMKEPSGDWHVCDSRHFDVSLLCADASESEINHVLTYARRG
jgi:hypothetical protein